MKDLKPSSDKEAAIFRLEDEIQQKTQELAKLRNQLEPVEVKDYTFTTPTGTLTLSQLFGDKDELILIQNMGTKCAYCTLWADGFNGFVPHLENRAAFVVTSNDSPQMQRAFAMERGWKFRMVSGQENTFSKDMGYQTDKGVLPGALAFQKKGGKIYRAGRDTFGPGDFYCGLWYLFDLLPEKDWTAKFHYFERK